MPPSSPPPIHITDSSSPAEGSPSPLATKNNIVPAVGTDDEVTRKNSTISSHYFSQRATVSPALVRGFYHFFKILNLPSIRHLQKMSATNFSTHRLAEIEWRRSYGKSLSRYHVLISLGPLMLRGGWETSSCWRRLAPPSHRRHHIYQ